MNADLWSWHRHLNRDLPARIITLEGHDGSGKSTLAGRLEEQLRADGRKVISLGEPGRISEQSLRELERIGVQPDHARRAAGARAALKETSPADHSEQLRLFEIARHASAQIENAWLSQPDSVIIKDRSWLSSLTHQTNADLSAVLPPEERWPELEHLAASGECVALLTITPNLNRHEDPEEALDFSTSKTQQNYQDLRWLGLQVEPEGHLKFRGIQLKQARLYWAYQLISVGLSC